MNEEGLYRYLKDMEECQVKLYQRIIKIEKKLKEIEDKNDM